MKKKEFALGIAKLEATYIGWMISNDPKRLDTWELLLKGIPDGKFDEITTSHCLTIKSWPTPASLMECASSYDQLTEMEVWACVSKAISHSAYNSREEHAKLPLSIRSLVTPELLKEWALLEDGVQTVIQSNFMRSYRQKKELNKKQGILDEPNPTQALMLGILKEV